ncbi:hypothetical protein [Nocardioides baculatus]|uniref:Secreted protein n=1 Tax=Nocardioides baculatus TaxID=2801337 RepID=A0ABS1LAZ8_9ACTN|nr:hypothetical protein [Nocardioides baculatus]MBL0748861.1 hypothetical protein [Nocardioides baculatus]
MSTIARALALAVAAALLPAAYVVAPPVTASAAQPTTEPTTLPATLRTALVDTDGDGLDDTRDGCPTVAASTSTGCPVASRKVALKWLAGKQRLQVQVSSPVGPCAQRARIALFRVRPNKDFKVFGGSTSFGGRLRVKVARGATYYATVPLSYSSGVAECGKAESRRVLAPRG